MKLPKAFVIPVAVERVSGGTKLYIAGCQFDSASMRSSFQSPAVTSTTVTRPAHEKKNVHGMDRDRNTIK